MLAPLENQQPHRSPNMKMMFVIMSCALICGCAQTIRIQDATGKPVKGASVSVVRYSLAPDPIGQTDAKGKFSFPRVPDVEMMTISKTGYKTCVFSGPNRVPKTIVLEKEIGEPLVGGDRQPTPQR